MYGDTAQITGYLNVELGRLETFMHQSIFNAQKENSLQVACQSSVLHQLLSDPDGVVLDNFTFDLLQVSFSLKMSISNLAYIQTIYNFIEVKLLNLE